MNELVDGFMDRAIVIYQSDVVYGRCTVVIYQSDNVDGWVK